MAKQSGGVLAEATTTPTDASLKEARTNAAVEPNAAGNLEDIGTDTGSEARHLVDKADLDRQEGIGSILDQLGGGEVTGDDRHGTEPFGTGQEGGGRETLVEQRAVEIGKDIDGTLVIGANDNALWIEGVEDGGALAEELGIGGDGIAAIRFDTRVAAVGIPDKGSNPVTGADGDGGLVDHDSEVSLQVTSDRLGGCLHLAEIGTAIGKGRGANSDEDHIEGREIHLIVGGGEGDVRLCQAEQFG